MRLLYVCSDFGIKPNGVKGASIHLRAITRGLSELGHDVRVLSPHPGPDGEHPASAVFDKGQSPDLGTIHLLRDWLRNHSLDESAGAELRPLIYNASIVEPALKALGKWRPHAVVERLSLFGHVGADLAAALGVPHVIEVNAILTEEARKYRTLALGGLAEEIERRTLCDADAVIAVSDALAEGLVRLGVRPERIHVVPNGFDPQMFEGLPSRDHCAEEFGVGGAFTIGFSGSLKPWHGVDIMMDAFAELAKQDSRCRLLVVGTGPMELALRDRATELGCADKIVFTGALPHETVPLALRAMDVAVAPFRHQHEFYFSPIKLFEYMASGACVVASRLGQIRDIVEDGGDGLLCEPDSTSDLVDKLMRLKASPQMRNRLATQAARRVRERFTWGHAAQKTEDVISRVIANRRARDAVRSESDEIAAVGS